MAINYLLLIDDSDIDNMVNRRMVEKSGFARHITVKKSARAGLEYLKDTFERNREELPEMIFLDIRMPEMDGFGFIEEFKKLDPFIVERCQIALLTSSIDPEDYRRAREIPLIKKFLNKPLSLKALAELEF